MGFVWCFLLMIRLGLYVFGRKTTEVKSHFYHVVSRIHTVTCLMTVEFDLDYLTEVIVRLLLWKVLSHSLPPFHTQVLERKALLVAFHIRVRELGSTSSMAEDVHKLFGTLLHKGFLFSLIYSCQRRLMDILCFRL